MKHLSALSGHVLCDNSLRLDLLSLGYGYFIHLSAENLKSMIILFSYVTSCLCVTSTKTLY